MDDLFRRAAERYPLHPGQNQWDAIEKKLSAASAPEFLQTSQRKNNHKKLLLFLLLIGISLLISFMILSLYSKNYPVAKIGDPINQTVNKYNHSVSKDSSTIHEWSENIKRKNEKISTSENKEVTQSDIPNKKNKVPDINILHSEIENNIFKKAPFKTSAALYPKNDNVTYQKQQNSETNRVSNSETRNETLFPERKNENNENKNIPSTDKMKIKPTSKTLKENGFYAGIIAGSDFSKVKTSSFKGPGFGTGILAGYKINTSVFIETGISSVTKYYSSDGNNFNEKEAAMPVGMVINNLDGRSEILEIPLKIGYRFYQNKNVNLFLAGGVATYLMTHEKNIYHVTMNGNAEKMEGNYKKDNVKIPAVFNISLGVEKHLSDVLKIRIEPYLKLPLQGVGVGKLPVTSAGIQIGLMGRLK